MPRLLTAVVLVAGLVLGWVAWTSRGAERVPEPVRSIPAGVPVALPEEVPEGHERRTYSVEGMHCSGCASTLLVSTSAVPGVADVAVDWRAGIVEAFVREGTGDEAVLAAFEAEEFSARRLP
jgi:copper chaperone CopZ